MTNILINYIIYKFIISSAYEKDIRILGKTVVVLFLFLFGFSRANAQSCDCSCDFAKMKEKVTANYAGFRDKATGGQEAAFRKFSTAIQNKAGQTRDFKQCTKFMREWLRFFKDGHLYLSVDDSTEYHHTYPPSFELRGDFCILKIPSFEYNYKTTLDSILAANHSAIISAKCLLIDLTGNGGGSDYTYESLVPYVYTKQVVVDMAEFWTSPDNIRQYRSIADDTSKPEQLRSKCREIADKMSVQLNSFVNIFGADSVHKSPDTLYAGPTKVAILTDPENASSAEQFLLEAKQSSRVVIFGTGNTSGTLDYSNLYFEYLPSGKRAVSIPTSRSLRVRKKPFDNIGCIPDVKIPKNTTDKIQFIINYMTRK